MIRPRTPRLTSEVASSSPNAPSLLGDVVVMTMMSPGLACSTAAWIIRLSPGQHSTVSAVPGDARALLVRPDARARGSRCGRSPRARWRRRTPASLSTSARSARGGSVTMTLSIGLRSFGCLCRRSGDRARRPVLGGAVSAAPQRRDDAGQVDADGEVGVVRAAGPATASRMARCSPSDTSGRPGRSASWNWCRTSWPCSRSSRPTATVLAGDRRRPGGAVPG